MNTQELKVGDEVGVGKSSNYLTTYRVGQVLGVNAYGHIKVAFSETHQLTFDKYGRERNVNSTRGYYLFDADKARKAANERQAQVELNRKVNSIAAELQANLTPAGDYKISEKSKEILKQMFESL